MSRVVHIGQAIEQELRAQGRSASWLARQLSCDRTNVYKIFRRPSIDTALLQRICSALDRNFFLLYQQE